MKPKSARCNKLFHAVLLFHCGANYYSASNTNGPTNN